MLISGVLSWVAACVMELFMLLFDTVAYALAICAICIFNGIARMDFFSTDVGLTMYTDLTRRIYAFIGIIMIFFFTYQLIMLVINPDGKSTASSDLVKKLITSLIMIAFFPTLYHYMAVFQEHVLTEGTIMGIVTGTTSGGDSDTMGRNTALIVYLSMFHPAGGGYQSLVNSDQMDENGNIVINSVEECQANSDASEETCKLWIDAMESYVNKSGRGFFGGITAFTLNHDLIETIFSDDGSDYMVIIIFVCGLVLAWFYISYAIDLGYRVIKLGFLQMISPAPLIMRIFPPTQGAYKTWRKQMFVTYVEIFARVAVVAFVITIIQYIPLIIVGLFQALSMSRFYWGAGVVAMVLGVMKFGKELPKLCKDMFASGGLFANFDWKPGVGRRLKAGKDELVGYGKKAAVWAGSKVVKAAATATRVKKLARGVKGAKEGIKLGREAFRKANTSATGASKKFGEAVAGAKGAAAAFNANKNISTKTPWSVARGLMNMASSNAGSSVKAGGLMQAVTDGVDKLVNGTSINATQANISKLSADNTGILNGFNDSMKLTDKLSKLTTLQDRMEQQFLQNGGKPTEGYTYNHKGEITGTKTFNDHKEIADYFKDLKEQVQLKAYQEHMANGMKANNFDKVVSALSMSGAKTIAGLGELDVDDGTRKAYAKKLSESMNSELIKAMNDTLGTNYDPSKTMANVKAHNREVELKDKELQAKNATLSAEVESLKSQIADRGAIESKIVNEDPMYYANHGDQVEEMVNKRIADLTAQLTEAQTKLADNDAAIAANNSTKIEKADMKDHVVDIKLEDIQDFLVEYAKNAENIKTDEANRDASAELLKQVHDLTKAISSNTDLISALKVPENEKKEESSGDKA